MSDGKPAHEWYSRYSDVVSDVTIMGGSEKFYWHLYFDGEKVNSGVADSRQEAASLIAQYRTQHHAAEFTSQYRWNPVQHCWIERACP